MNPHSEWKLLPNPVSGVTPDGQVASVTSMQFTGLIPGATYEFIIFSPNGSGGCVVRGKANLPIPTQSTMTSTTSDGIEGCVSSTSGRVDFSVRNWNSATSHINYSVYTYPDYQLFGSTPAGTLSVNSTMTQTTSFVNGLPTGAYVLVFEEVGGCVTASEPFLIRNFTPLSIGGVSVVRAKAGCTQKGELKVENVQGDVHFWVSDGDF